MPDFLHEIGDFPRYRGGAPAERTNKMLRLFQTLSGVAGIGTNAIAIDDGLLFRRSPQMHTLPNVRHAKITDRAGVAAPWLYSASEVEYNNSGDLLSSDFETVDGGDSMEWTLINLNEIGDLGDGASPIPVGAIVTYWPLSDGYYGCNVDAKRGTY